MKIRILGGSPNRDGSTQLLIDSFSRGARHAVHDAAEPLSAAGL